MRNTLDKLAVIERRDAWIRRLSQLFFAALFALLLTGAIVAALAFILDQREQTQRDSRAAASRRIDMLQGLVNAQANQIADNARQIGRLTTTVDALAEQLRQNRLEPVVVLPSPASGASPRPTKTTDPSASPAPRATPAPRPSPSSSPKPSPSPSPCRVPNPAPNPLVGRCVVR